MTIAARDQDKYEREKARWRERYYANRELRKAQIQASQGRRGEEYKAYRREYMREYQQRPEAKTRHAEVQRIRNYLGRGKALEVVVPLVVLERDDGVCGICGEDVDPMDFHIDHIVPFVRGGEHSYANTQAAHPACNRRKGGG